MKARSDIPFTFTEIARILGVPTPHTDRPIHSFVTDSREAQPGDLFFALEGPRYNGNDFLDEVLQKGALAVSTQSRDNVLTVRDTRAALLAVAEEYRRRLPARKKTVAITGSVGKTTTKELLSTLLRASYKVHATKENYNNEIGLPMTILSAARDTEMLILEIGINHPGEMAQLSSAACADIAVITNVGHAHIGNFGSTEQLLKEKLAVTAGMPDGGPLLVLAEDTRLLRHEHTVSVSLTEKYAPFALVTRHVKDGIRECMLFEDGLLLATIRLPFEEEGAYRNCALAMAAACLCGGEPNTFEESLWQASRACLRMQERTFFGGGRLLDDSYNASPESMEHALRTLSHTADGERCVLLGDMLELGTYTEQMHREIGRSVFLHGVKRAFFYGVYAPFYRLGAMEAGMQASSICINNDITMPQQTVRQIREHCDGTETILCKASHGMHLEDIIHKITI